MILDTCAVLWLAEGNREHKPNQLFVDSKSISYCSYDTIICFAYDSLVK